MSFARSVGARLAAVVRPLERLPIRWRLAGTSALLTLVILCGFAFAVGELTTLRIRSDFNHETAAAADELGDQIVIRVYPRTQAVSITPNLDVYAGPNHAAIRVVADDGSVIRQTRNAPNLGPPYARMSDVAGYRVETRRVQLNIGSVYVQYGRRISDLQATLARVRLFLLIGVLGGTGLALLAGLMIARRAMAPITALTDAARGIALTRDARREVPRFEADDEVAELARTLDGMLHSLAEARTEIETMLARQRQFVADASHELRTPLTSVLANLELLAESLEGEQGESARAALRSSRRMRRLVVDLLLLARADVGRTAERLPIDLADVALEAVSELGPVAERHELSVDARPARILGTRDELLRLTINLVENALRHTPAGSHVALSTAVVADGTAELRVCDDGPGVPLEVAPRLFERFVRGSGDRGGSFGIGLAIVRAVSESHGGSVTLEPVLEGGACFVVRLPALAVAGTRGSGSGAAAAGDRAGVV